MFLTLHKLSFYFLTKPCTNSEIIFSILLWHVSKRTLIQNSWVKIKNISSKHWQWKKQVNNANHTKPYPTYSKTMACIEKLQRNLLWQGNPKKKYHLIDCASVCKPKQEGGLSIRLLRQMDQALLGKWLWRIGCVSEGLQRQVLMAKCAVLQDG